MWQEWTECLTLDTGWGYFVLNCWANFQNECQENQGHLVRKGPSIIGCTTRNKAALEWCAVLAGVINSRLKTRDAHFYHFNIHVLPIPY